MSAEISTDALQNESKLKPRPHFVCSALTVAALANAAVPALFFSATRLFGPTDPRYRAMVAVVVLIEYAIVFFLLLFHANEPFASGYAFATAAIVTLASAGQTYIVLAPAGWGWGALYPEIIVVCGLLFAVLSNVVFLLASIKYARAVQPRLHLGGFFLGIAASLALLLFYIRILP
ncbi:MAG: hypothetical protein WCA00_04035 [Candidatus Acidiferrales bacterium]